MLREFFGLSRQALFVLARRWSELSGQDPQSPDAPKDNWSWLRLFSLISGHARPGLARKNFRHARPQKRASSTTGVSRRRSSCPSTDSRGSRRHQSTEIGDVPVLLSELCRSYVIASKFPRRGAFCPGCWRCAICPQHAVDSNEEFERTHEMVCEY